MSVNGTSSDGAAKTGVCAECLVDHIKPCPHKSDPKTPNQFFNKESFVEQPPNPRENANIFSIAFFWWFNPLLGKGYNKDLEIEDIYESLKCDKSKSLGEELEREWDKELEKSKKCKSSGKEYTPSLLKALIRQFGPYFCFLGIFTVLEECILRIFQPLFMGWMMQYFQEDSQVTKEEAYLYGLGIVLMSAFYTFTHHPYFFGVMHTGSRIRIACCALLYRKALKLSNSALGQTTIGQMVNLLSNDVNRFDQSILFIHYLWAGPLQLLIVTGLLWKNIGPSALVGTALLIAFVPIQTWVGRKFGELRVQTATRTDKRIRLMNEIVNGIKVIKMYCWEKSFTQMVQEARKDEIAVVRHTSYYRSFNFSFFFTASRFILLCTFLVYGFTGHFLTPDKAFVTLSLYNTVRLSMTLFFPFAISQTGEAKVSIDRIKKFLMLEEKDNSVSPRTFYPKDEKACVEMKHITGKWNKDEIENTLEDVDFKINPGTLVAVIGPVGSGKSSLLQCILGELPVSRGKVDIFGDISYAPQESWVFSGNVRDNILFGQPYKEKWYRKVVSACALEHDFQQWEFGDKTLVGEKGVALSGGQKARVTLARSVYRSAECYLLDDPLSAVDAHVGKHLFQSCIKELLSNKAVILVTHQLQYLKDADHIVVMKQGRIQEQGTFQHLVQNGLDFSAFLASEKESTGASSIRSNGVSKALYSGSDIWMSYWTTQEERRIQLLIQNKNQSIENDIPSPIVDSFGDIEDVEIISPTNQTIFQLEEMDQKTHYFNLGIYAAIVLALVVTSMIRTVYFFIMCMRASVKLHNSMFMRVVRAPSRFFDTNPVGRILNRFSKDVGSMDELLPPAFFDAFTIFLNICGIMAVIFAVRPWIMLPTLVLAVIFVLLRRFYMRSARDIKRIEGVSRSPVFSQLSTTLQGLTTIRAFSAQEMLRQEFDRVQDVHTSTWYAFISGTRWFGVWLDWIVVVYLAITVFSFLILGGSIDGGDVGLAISNCIMLTGMLQWGVRQSAEVENLMTSVERVREYSELEQESPAQIPETEPPPHVWPSEGVIEFKDVELRYAETEPLVLKGLNLKTKPCEKIGIVGRTGAGKSSMITALFRLAEPTGSIVIDGVDVLKIGLDNLRSAISIIPQDPLLFTGSLRRNLDPFDEFSDDVVWNVLREVHLAEAVSDLKDGLETEMSEGGLNFSVGQRQLVCLARAVLRKITSMENKILVLDEATANVDPRTDQLIQEQIRTRFRNCTVLTIAHRLHTIMDSDRIIVLSDGKVIEFDEPYELLLNPDGVLTELVAQTGEESKNKLTDMAKLAQQIRKQENENLV